MAATGAPPRLLLAVGAPDGMSAAAATKLFDAGRLPGISGICSSLIPWLVARGHSFNVTLFGSGRPLSAENARRSREQTGGDVLVNMICEPQQQSIALDQVARYELATQLPVVNASGVVKATTRPLIAQRLAHQDGVRVPHCTLWRTGGPALTEHIERHGHDYPLLLRPLGQHGSVGLVRVDDPAATTAAAATLPACTVTDFVDFRSADGLWRKHRIVYSGDRLFRRHVLIDREWNITRAARRFMRDRPDLVAEEQAWIKLPLTLERGSVEARILHQFRALQLDFGVIDFALSAEGDLVVFEINACVQITNRVDAQAAGDRRYFEANNEEILSALLQAICERAPAR